MQLLDLKFPANAGFMLNFLVTVATFDPIPVETIWYFFDLPEGGSHSLSFQSSGYEYKNLIENMGSSFFLIQIYLIQCLLVLVIWILIKHGKFNKLTKLREKMKEGLFWSVPLRFMFEAYLELSICVSIGLLNLQWDNKNFSIQYNAIFTIVFVILVIILPLFTLIFYYCKIDSVEDDGFKTKYGTLFDGLQLDMEEGKRK